MVGGRERDEPLRGVTTMRKIGVRFSDNDFMHALLPFMEQLQACILDGPDGQWEPTRI